MPPLTSACASPFWFTQNTVFGTSSSDKTRLGKITRFCFNYNYNIKFSVTITIIQVQVIVIQLQFHLQLH